MNTIVLILAAAGGWFALACLAWLFVYMPMFRSARRTDALMELAAAEQLDAPRRLQGSGYTGLVLDRTADLARSLLGVERSWILLRDPGEDDGLILAAARGLDDDLIGRRFSSAETLGEAASAAASAPIVLDGSVHGVFSVASADAETLNAAQLELLRELAQLCGAGLAHHGRRRDAEQRADVQLGALQKALDAWDDETAAHSEHVVQLAMGVGERLGLRGAELIELELGARLHDVGKLRVPASVLRKPGPLTSQERRLVECHAAWGSEIVAEIPALQAVASIVRHHHERFDGGGYPSGLSGTRTPLASRILGACDAYSAMTRDRPYRRARPRAEALTELRAHAGTQFDATVVDALTEVCSEPRIRRPSRRRSHRRSMALATGALAIALLLPAAQAAADCPGEDARPGEASPAEIEVATVCLINELRADRGIRPLHLSRKLAVAGARHANDMVERRYFGHTSLDGSAFSARVIRTGYVPSDARWMLGENLAWGTGDLSTPRSRVAAWFDSLTHRRVMLEDRFHEVGVGVAQGVPYPTKFSVAGTYAAEFGAVWGGSQSRATATRSSWGRSRGSSRSASRFKQAGSQ